MTELTLERLAKLEMLRSAVERALDKYTAHGQHRDLAVAHDGANLVYMANLANSAPELFAAARRLLELESALRFIAADSDLFDLWKEDDGYHAETPHGLHGVTASSVGEALLHHCRRRGWPGIESGKGGDDV